MARKEKTETIDGLKITTVQHPAVAGALMWARILPLVAPALRNLPEGFKFRDVEAMGAAKLVPAIVAVCERLQGDKLESLMLELFQHTTAIFKRGGKAVNVSLADRDMIDEVFDGRVGTLVKAMKFAIGVNFASFGLGATSKTSVAPQEEAADAE
jgi:hypothetical protein